jgi:hypothetical protein
MPVLVANNLYFNYSANNIFYFDETAAFISHESHGKDMHNLPTIRWEVINSSGRSLIFLFWAAGQGSSICNSGSRYLPHVAGW